MASKLYSSAIDAETTLVTRIQLLIMLQSMKSIEFD